MTSYSKYILGTDLKYPRIIASGSVTINSAAQLASPIKLYSNILSTNTYDVSEKRILGLTSDYIIQSINGRCYVDANNELYTYALFNPSVLYWRIYDI